MEISAQFFFEIDWEKSKLILEKSNLVLNLPRLNQLEFPF